MLQEGACYYYFSQPSSVFMSSMIAEKRLFAAIEKGSAQTVKRYQHEARPKQIIMA